MSKAPTKVQEEEVAAEPSQSVQTGNSRASSGRREERDWRKQHGTEEDEDGGGGGRGGGQGKKKDSFSSWFHETERRRSICALCQVLRGSLAGAAAKTLVYPLDRLKMHLQVSVILFRSLVSFLRSFLEFGTPLSFCKKVNFPRPCSSPFFFSFV